MEEGQTCNLAAQRVEPCTVSVLRTESWHVDDIPSGGEHSRNLNKVFLSSHIDPSCHTLPSTNEGNVFLFSALRVIYEGEDEVVDQDEDSLQTHDPSVRDS